MDNINIDAVVGNDPAPLEILLNCLSDPPTAEKALALWKECLAARADSLLLKVASVIETCNDIDTRKLCIARLQEALAKVDIWNALAGTSKVFIRRVLLHLVKDSGVDVTTKESVSYIVLDVIDHGGFVDWIEFREFVLDCLKSRSIVVQYSFFKIFKASRRQVVDLLLSDANVLNLIHDDLHVLLQHNSEDIKCAAVTALVNFLFVFNQEEDTDITIFRDLAELIVSGLLKMMRYFDYADCFDVLCLLGKLDPHFFTHSIFALRSLVQDLILIGSCAVFPKHLRLEAFSLVVHTTTSQMGASPEVVKPYVSKFYRALHTFMADHLEDTDHAHQQLDYLTAHNLLRDFINRVGFDSFMFGDAHLKGILLHGKWTDNHTAAEAASLLAPTITETDVRYELEVSSLVGILTRMIKNDNHLKVQVAAYKAIIALAEKLRTFLSTLFARFVIDVRPLVLEKFRKRNLPRQLKEVLEDGMVKLNTARGRMDEMGRVQR